MLQSSPRRKTLAGVGAGLMLVLGLPGAGLGQDLPFSLPTPEGWREETIPFPLSFAPELDYEGLEELRFAPGMFEAGSEDYWTYAFVWWLPAGPRLTGATLASDLETYFRGLTRAVAESRGFDPGEPEFRASLQPSARAPANLRGEVLAYDPFTARAPVRLLARVEIRPCGEAHQAAFFGFSPRPESHEVWKTLEEIRAGLACAGGD